MTLLDQARGMKDQVMAGIVLQFAREGMVFQKLGFMSVDALTLKTWQLESVTDAVYRTIGNTYSETKDTFTEKFEGIYLLGGKIDIDRALRLPGQKEIDAYAENLLLQSKRFMYGFMDTFVNGDRSVNPDRFDGIKVRVTAVGGNQVVTAATNGLDVSASAANQHTFLDKVNQCIFDTGMDSKPDFIVTSRQGYLTLQSVARRLGLLDITKDAFDRQIFAYSGIPILDVGTKGDQSTQIITNTETVGTSSATTSFYFIRLGKQYLTGIQMHEPRRIFDDITDDGVTHRVVFEWPVGLATFHNKSIVHLKGVIPI